jgi:hypothetical protein
MELASMLAGEPFSDRPRCADPVIASFLRAFNDRLGHAQRQELRPYAAAVVGTRASRRLTRARRRRCLRFACGRDHAGPVTRLRMAVLMSLRAALRVQHGAPEWAARQAIATDDVEGGFALLDALLAEGTGDARPVYLPHAPTPADPPDSARPAEHARPGEGSRPGAGLRNEPVH